MKIAKINGDSGVVMNDDPRGEIYSHLTDEILTKAAPKNRTSAQRIFDILSEYIPRPRSVLDVGCGTGTWMHVAQDMGIPDVRGIEGKWLDASKLEIDPALVETFELEQPFTLDRKFDLLVCLEVAEHLSPAAAEGFIDSLTRHADAILFSAAIPDQGGADHLNERFPGYWARLFAQHNFHPLDFIRPRIWNDSNVLWWLQQNTLLFVHDRLLAANPKLSAERDTQRILSVVHPILWQSRMKKFAAMSAEHQRLIAVLSQGGAFNVSVQSDGSLSITR